MTEERGVVALTDLTGAVRRHWAVALVGLLAGLLAGVGYVALTQPSYSATATVTVKALDDPSDTGAAQPPSMATQRTVVSSGAVADQVARSVDGPKTGPDLTEHLTVSSPDESQVLDITYTARTPAMAATVANAFADSYLDYRKGQAQQVYDEAQQGIRSQLDNLTKRLGKVEKRLDDPGIGPAEQNAATVERSQLFTQISQLRADSTRLATHVPDPGEVVNRAAPPDSPSSRRAVVGAAVGVVLGVLFAAAFVAWRERTNTPLTGSPDVERRLRRPVLAAAYHRRAGRGDHGYRVAVSKLLADTPPESLLVTASGAWTAHVAARSVAYSAAELDVPTTLAETAAADDADDLVRAGVAHVQEQPTRDLLQYRDDDGLLVAAMSWKHLPELLLVARFADMVVPIVVSGVDRHKDVRAALADLEEAAVRVPGVIVVGVVTEPAGRSEPSDPAESDDLVEPGEPHPQRTLD